MKAILSRKYDKNQTPGIMVLLSEGEMIFACQTLELKDMGNLRRMSCIPEGTYKVQKMIRPDGRNGLWVKSVPNRTAILIHSGNYAAGTMVDTEGCILVGGEYEDKNKDGNLDIVDSKITFEDLFEVAADEFELEII